LKKNNRLMQVIAAAVTCLVVASSGYAQQLLKGKFETTGQVGIATGIGTQASFAGTLGKVVKDNVLVLGEFGWIPLGGANASGSVPGGSFDISSGGRVLTFMAGAQYQFRETRSFVPYAGAALGIVDSSGGFEGTIGGSNQNVNSSRSDFYVSFGGGARYYVKDSWGFKPEFMIFAGDNTFFRFGGGIFYQFGR
jgi:Outer membrane protein beta-barrel domain